MGDLYKKNWKRVTGVRGQDPLTDLEIVRLKDIIAGGSGVSINGDIGGTNANPVVVGLQGEPVAATAPASGEVLAYNGSQWEPSATAGGALASGFAGDFRVDIPAGGSLAAKIAGATLPAGWSIVLGNDGTVDSEIVATVNDIALIHTEGAFVGDLTLHEYDSTGAPLGGYYIINDSAVSPLSKSNTLGTQFTVLGFAGLITLSRRQIIYVKLLSTP